MLCVLKNGTEIEVPDVVISTGQIMGMVAVAGNTVSESDVVRVDEAAQDRSFGQYTHPLSWRRLYFELADGEQLEWPVGRQSRTLSAVWELTTADIRGLKAKGSSWEPAYTLP